MLYQGRRLRVDCMQVMCICSRYGKDSLMISYGGASDVFTAALCVLFILQMAKNYVTLYGSFDLSILGRHLSGLPSLEHIPNRIPSIRRHVVEDLLHQVVLF